MPEIDETPLVAEVEQLLKDRGPMSMSELISELGVRGFELEPDPEHTLTDVLYYSIGDECEPLVDDRWVHAPTLLMDRVFTHRLSDSEVTNDVLGVNPDLEAVLAIRSDLLRLTDGTPLDLAFPGLDADRPNVRELPAEALEDFGSLPLPPGTLRSLGVSEGDLVGLWVTSNGIELRPVAAADIRTDYAQVQEGLREIVSDEPQDVQSAVLTVCADLPHAFREASLPVAELFAGAGLVHDGDYVAEPGFNFAEHRLNLSCYRIEKWYGLNAHEALAVVAMLSLHNRLVRVIDDRLDDLAPDELLTDIRQATAMSADDAYDTRRAVISLVPALSSPDAAEAFLAEAIGDGTEGAPALGLLVETAEELATRSARPALRWLRAKAHERLGNIVEAEECLLAAERLDPDWPLTLLDLARYASDRGDSLRGLALLRRASPYRDPRLEVLLQRFLPDPGPILGRNQPCWCGSGRKFKQCHLNRVEPLPLEGRAAWLYQKAGRFLADGPWRPRTVELAAEHAAHAANDEDAATLARDPLVPDAVLFEGGAFAEFLEVRGALLPEDERLLANQWLLVERSVFEVTGVWRGEGFTVRDLRTGDAREVSDRTVSRELNVGQMICARIVPAGETMQIFGGIEPVALQDRDDLIALLDSEPEPEELVAFYSRQFAPPASVVSDKRQPANARDAVRPL
jgi:tetratricopeptide (TPR) repeat protein